MIRSIARTALVAALAASGLSLADPAAAQRRSYGPISVTRPARIVYEGACGWNGSGQAAYVLAGSRTRSVVVTIRASFEVGPNRWSRTSTFALEPGARQWVDCTRGDNSMEWTRFSIAGERAFGAHGAALTGPPTLGDAILDRAQGALA